MHIRKAAKGVAIPEAMYEIVESPETSVHTRKIIAGTAANVPAEIRGIPTNLKVRTKFLLSSINTAKKQPHIIIKMTIRVINERK